MIIEDEICITDLETLKVISDPLRVQILEHIGLVSDSGELITVKQLSEDLGIPQTKLYYHVKLLEKHNLIQVADTRVVSGIIEKHYQIRARRIRADLDIAKNAEVGRDEGMALTLASVATILDSAYQNIEKSFQHRMGKSDPSDDQTATMLSTQAMIQLSLDQAETFIQRLNELIAEYADADHRGGLPFSLTIVFNPNYHIPISRTGGTICQGEFRESLLDIDKTSDRIPPQL